MTAQSLRLNTAPCGCVYNATVLCDPDGSDTRELRLEATITIHEHCASHRNIAVTSEHVIVINGDSR